MPRCKRGAINSKRRFTYEEVDEYLANRKAWKQKLDARRVAAARPTCTSWR